MKYASFECRVPSSGWVNGMKLSRRVIARSVDRGSYPRLPSKHPSGVCQSAPEGLWMVARGRTPGARGRGDGFDHDKAALHFMPLPGWERVRVRGIK